MLAKRVKKNKARKSKYKTETTVIGRERRGNTNERRTTHREIIINKSETRNMSVQGTE